MSKMTLAFLGLGLLLAGCSVESSPDHLQTTGRYPDLRNGNIQDMGILNIENVVVPTPYTGSTGRTVPLPAPLYAVYDQNGDFVDNARSKTISLPPGRYLIRLNHEEPEKPPFWVTIESGKTTDLDANAITPSQADTLNAK